MADMREIHLEHANLWAAHLESSNLRNAHLRDTNFRYAHLNQANLEGANLDRADFYGTHIEGANFKSVIGASVTQIKAAQGWQFADYDTDFRAELGLLPLDSQSLPTGPPQHQASLRDSQEVPPH
jgi:uncharacterized protein YjbI with pentapeptide repeats